MSDNPFTKKPESEVIVNVVEKPPKKKLTQHLKGTSYKPVEGVTLVPATDKPRSMRPRPDGTIATAKQQGTHPYYSDMFPEMAYRYCLLGASSHTDLAKLFDVSKSTIENWIRDYPEFAKAIKDGGENADAQVANALFRKATGYTRTAKKTIVTKQGNPIEVEQEDYYPPDTAAGQFWLKNRAQTKWRDKIEQEITGKNGAPLQIDHTLSPSEAYLKMLGKA